MSSAPPESFRPSPPGAQLVRPHFSLFGVPVRVSPSFWMIGLFFWISTEGQTGKLDVVAGLVWTAVVFVSILVHELGHALVAKAFGAKPAMTLYAMGGLTSYPGGSLSRLQHTLVSAAGPGAGLALGLLVFAATRSAHLSANAHELVRQVLWVNIGWSLINLMPVVPLDGGHILAGLLGPKRAFASAVISVLVGTAASAASLIVLNSVWLAFIFGGGAVTAMRQVRYGWRAAADRRRGLEGELARARSAIAAGEAEEVHRLGSAVARQAQTPIVRNGGLLAMAWAEATSGKAMVARQTLERLERGTPVDPYFLAAVESALGSAVRARAILETARQQGARNIDSTKLLIDLWAREGDLGRATQVAIEDADLLGPVDARSVLVAAMQGDEHRLAASLAAKLYALYHDPVDALDEARAFALAGDRSHALDCLEALARGENGSSGGQGVRGWHDDPAFETLRGDARFQQLLSA